MCFVFIIPCSSLEATENLFRNSFVAGEEYECVLVSTEDSTADCRDGEAILCSLCRSIRSDKLATSKSLSSSSSSSSSPPPRLLVVLLLLLTVFSLVPSDNTVPAILSLFESLVVA